jgi:hypothetical protein
MISACVQATFVWSACVSFGLYACLFALAVSGEVLQIVVASQWVNFELGRGLSGCAISGFGFLHSTALPPCPLCRFRPCGRVRGIGEDGSFERSVERGFWAPPSSNVARGTSESVDDGVGDAVWGNGDDQTLCSIDILIDCGKGRRACLGGRMADWSSFGSHSRRMNTSESVGDA